jgi:AcrR family transcriptional regulator
VPTTPRGEKTRRRIIERASVVFEERGFVGASMNHLVEATGLTRGAFYFHFESKEAVALAIVQAQAERWPALVAQVEREESEPLRRLLRLAFAAGEAVQSDPLIRAAHRLMAELAASRKELPGTFQWWVDTVGRYLRDADSRRQLPDLEPLVSAGSSIDPVTTLAEYVVARWAGVQQAALASGRNDLPDRVHTSWVILLPWLSRTPADRAALHEFVRELSSTRSTAGRTIPRPSSEPTPSADGSPDRVG